MPALFRSRRARPTRLFRRFALFALFALEAGVALGPVLEPHHEPMASHVERTGTRHQFLVHDEATCVFCTLRSHRSMPSHARVAIPTVRTLGDRWLSAVAGPTRPDGALHAARAPPRSH